MKKLLKFLGFLLVAFYLYKAADLYFFQEKYIFHPEASWETTPQDEGISFENVTLEASDGVKLSAWYVPVEDAKGTVIFLHGNARNISAEMEAIGMYHTWQYNVMMLDYRGFGKSEGKPTEEGTYLDARAAWNWLLNEKNETPNRIVICGRSLGASIATDLAAEHQPKGLILEAAFTSLPNVGQEHYPFFPVKLLSKYRYDTLARLKDVTCPVLIVHSRDDKVVPLHHSKTLYEAVKGKKAYVEIGGPHKGGYKPTREIYKAGILGFLDSL